MNLNRIQSIALADALDDTPPNCIARHALLTGRGRAYTTGSHDTYRAAVVEPSVTPGELLAFGDDIASIGKLLGTMHGWKCVEIAPELADELAAALAADLGTTIERSRDLYFTLADANLARVTADAELRVLTPADADEFARSGASYCVNADDARRNVIEGPVVAARVDGQIVAAAEANVRTHRYANFTVHTAPAFRGRGLSTACTAHAARIVRELDLIPLWSCDERNVASRRVAEKVGVKLVGHCVYLWPAHQHA